MSSGQPQSSASTPSPRESQNSLWKYYKNLLIARTIRYLGVIGFFWHNYLLSPRCHRASFTRYIDSITSENHKGKHKIRLDVYLPLSHSHSDPSISKRKTSLRPAIINFHGGGFTIGHSRDDARWALYTTDYPQYLDGIFISVGYRLAPEYPFPTPVEDCADAIKYVFENAEELGVDREKILLSGFSAGGCLAFAGWMLSRHPDKVGYQGKSGISGDIRGIIAFYPLLDYLSPRPVKLANHHAPDLAKPLPGFLVDLFDTSYLPKSSSNPIERHHPLVSPSLAPDTLIKHCPPVHMVLCEADVLLGEGAVFAERLRKLGKKASVRIVKGEMHGWDKPPHLVKKSVGIEYAEAMRVVKGWLEE